MRCAKSTEQRRARPLCLLPALLLLRALPVYPATAKPPAAQNHRTAAGGHSHGGGAVPNYGGPGAHSPDDAVANNLMLLVFRTMVVLVHTIMEVVIQTPSGTNHLSSLYQLDRCNI